MDENFSGGPLVCAHGFQSGLLDFVSWRQEIGRLRHEVFAKTLGWVSTNTSGLELDKHDNRAEHIGVFSTEDNPKKLISYARLLPKGHMMIENQGMILSQLAEGFNIPERAVEASRHCRNLIGAKFKHKLAPLLVYYSILEVMRENSFSHLLVVADDIRDLGLLGVSYYKHRVPLFREVGRRFRFKGKDADTVLLMASLEECHQGLKAEFGLLLRGHT